MNWMNTPIEQLEDTALLLAKTRINEMKNKYDARLAERKPRHDKIEFGVSVVYTQLAEEINAEIEKRGI